MRLIIFGFGLILASFANAAAVFPVGCQAIPVHGDEATVNGKKTQLILLHNTSKTDLWITHPEAEQSAHAGWTSRLEADHWSALAVDKGPFNLGCIESRPGHEQQVPCEGVMVMCSWQKVKMPAGNQGAFWAGEDMSLAELTTALGGRGFVLPTQN